MKEFNFNLLVLSYVDQIEQWKANTLEFINNSALEESLNITLFLVCKQDCELEFDKVLSNRVELRKLCLQSKSSKGFDLSIEMLFANEVKDSVLSHLEEILMEKDFDIIQFDSIAFMQFYDNIRAMSESKLVYRQFYIESNYWAGLVKKYRLSVFKYLGMSKLVNKLKQYEQLANLFDLVVVSKASYLDYYNAGNVVVIPTKIEQDTVRQAIPMKNQNKLFFIGNLKVVSVQYALLWFLNDVWSELLTKLPDLEFYIVGETEPWFEQLLINRKNVFYQPKVDDLNKFMQDKLALILPYETPVGILPSYLKAMHKGKVIVANNKAVCCWGLTAMIHYMAVRENVKFVEVLLHLFSKREISEYFSNQIYNFANETINLRYLTRITLRYYYTLLIQNSDKHDKQKRSRI